jgi:hypothetical protein
MGIFWNRLMQRRLRDGKQLERNYERNAWTSGELYA